MWFLCKKAVLNNLRKGVILIVQNVKNIQNICSRKRWCHVGCLPLKENTVAGFPPFGIWRFFGQMLISPHWGFEQIAFSHRSTCTFFFQKTGIFPPKFLLLTGFLSTLFGWLGCCLSSRSSRYKIWIRKTGRSQPTGDQDQTPLLHKYPTCWWSEMQKQTGEKSDRAKREGARWPEATLYRGVMGVFRLG